MNNEEFDPVAHGQQTAKENAKSERQLNGSTSSSNNGNVERAQETAKVNSKLDRAATDKAKMVPVKVSTTEVDTPEGGPVTDEPQEGETDESEASSKDPNVKKNMSDAKKRQNTSKDSATPSPKKTADKKSK